MLRNFFYKAQIIGFILTENAKKNEKRKREAKGNEEFFILTSSSSLKQKKKKIFFPLFFLRGEEDGNRFFTLQNCSCFCIFTSIKEEKC